MEQLILYDIQLQLSDDEPNSIELLDEISNFYNYEILVKFYEDPTNLSSFTKDEFLLLIDNLNRLDCKSLKGVIIIALNTYPKIKNQLSKDLIMMYDRLELEPDLFLNLCKYGTYFLLDDNEEDLNKGVILASETGNLDVIKYLVKKGADIFDITLLKNASKYGHLNVIKFLSDNGVDITVESNLALKNASRYGHLNMVKFLIEMGVNIHTDYDFAFRFACENGHYNVVRLLAEEGANISALNDYAIIAAIQNNHLKIAKFLIERGIDFKNVRDEISLLDHAVRTGKIELVDFLISNGIAVDDFSVMEAVTNGHFEIFKLLLKSGGQINDELLIRACDVGKIDIVEFLVEKGANVNHSNDRSLLISCFSKRYDIVKFLLQNGANPNLEDDIFGRLRDNELSDEIRNLLHEYGMQ